MLIRLIVDIDPNTLSISTDALLLSDGFNSSGIGYFKDGDSFAYTSLDKGNFLGCTGLAHVHEESEQVYSFWGYRIRDVIAPFELESTLDSDEVVDTLVTVIDNILSTTRNVHHQLYGGTNPLIAHPEALQSIVESQGGEYSTTQSEYMQRWLSMAISDILKGRGTKAAFQFIAYLLTGYETNVRLNTLYIPFGLDSSFGEMLGAPEELEVDSQTLGLWRIAASPALTIPNEADSAFPMTIDNVGMWDTTHLCGMFMKDQILEFINNDGVTFHLPFNSDFFIEMFFKFGIVNSYPQIILQRGSEIVITRTDVTSIKIEVTEGGVTYTLIGTDVLNVVDERYAYIGVVYKENEFALQIDGQLVDRQLGTFPDLTPSHTVWEFGGVGGNFLNGSLDMLKIGKIGYLSQFSHYFEHIRISRTVRDQVF